MNPLNLPPVLLIYVAGINVISFLCFGIDKWKAQHRKWRISEGALLVTVLFGGGIGGWIGMYLFHHKVNKPKFSIGVPLIILIELGLTRMILFTF